MRSHRPATLRGLYDDAVGPAACGWPPWGKPMTPHNRSLTGPMRKGAWSMKALSSLLLVSLGIGVAAPAAARPSGAALPVGSAVLLNLNVAAPAPAGPRILDAASWRLNADRAVG